MYLHEIYAECVSQLGTLGKCCKGEFELISPWSATNTAGAGLAG